MKTLNPRNSDFERWQNFSKRRVVDDQVHTWNDDIVTIRSFFCRDLSEICRNWNRIRADSKRDRSLSSKRLDTTATRGGLYDSDTSVLRKSASGRLRSGATTAQYHTLIGFSKPCGCDSNSHDVNEDFPRAGPRDNTTCMPTE